MSVRKMRLVAIAFAGLPVVFGTSSAFADAAAAKQYIEAAKAKIESKDLDDATKQLELAEIEAEDTGGAKAPLLGQINELKQKIVGAKSSADKPKYVRTLRNLMDDAEGNVGNLVTWQGTANQLEELFKDPAAKAALGDDLAAAEKKYQTFKKLHVKKAAVANLGVAEDQVSRFEKEFPESMKSIQEAGSPEGKVYPIERLGRDFESVNKTLATLPDDDAKAVALRGRVEKLNKQFIGVALAEQTKGVVEQLKRGLDLYTNEYAGWEKETKAPTWAEYSKQSGGAMSSFLMPKTKAFVERMESFLKQSAENDDVKRVAAAPEVKQLLEATRKQTAAAREKLYKAVKPVVDAALAGKANDAGAFGRLKDDVRVTLGEDDEQSKVLVAKVGKVIDGHETATAGAETAKGELVTKLRTLAETSWPKLYEGMPYTTEIDLSTPGAMKGKSIGFLADNLMGYRFKPGDHYFATTLGGVPVAAKIDPELMKGIKAIEAKIGRSLGDDDDDGKWDVIATVTDKRVKLLAKRQVDATGTVDGANVKVTGEYAEPVDAVVIEITAAKCGPFAGAKGRGVVTPDGTIAKP